MSFSLGRATFSLILAPCVVLSAAVPPDHLHESAAGHPHAPIHRHLQPHAILPHDHDLARLADDDEQIVWLDSVAEQQSVFQVSAVALPPAERFELVRTLVDWVVRPDHDAAPPHGPPRACLSLRAPPPSA